jgi:hypothetical protein
MRSQLQLLGFYLAGLVCVVLAILRLTIEGQWSWWRVLLPLWVMLGHNFLYIAVGFAWLCFADDGQATIRRSDGAYAYQLAAMFCFLIFADNLLGRIEGTGETTWLGLKSEPWVLIVVSGTLSVMCHLLFWFRVLPAGDRRTWNK